MGIRRRRRSFIPVAGVLEQRRLLTLSALWLGQDGGDYVGTEGTLVQQAPNDYQDVHFRLTGLTGETVARVEVERYGGGGWSWSPLGGKNAFFRPDPSNPTLGDLYLEPYFADPAGTLYQAVRVIYADGSVAQADVRSTTAVDPNLRTPGKGLEASFLGQDGQDWTGASIAVGPDGHQDVHVAIANLSAGAAGYVRITAATTPPRSWEAGVNPDGRWNAEMLDRAGTSATLGTTADLFFSSDVNLANVPLTIQVFYDHWNPDYRSYTNRSGKSDVVVVTAGATSPGLATPAVAEANLSGFVASSRPQDAQYPGFSHAAIDAASLAALPSPQSFATIRSAVLSDRRGAAWLFLKPGAPAPYTGFPSPTAMRLDAASGVLDFPPVRDESGSTLTLRLTFDDGSEAVSRFAAATADLGRLAVDPRVGATTRIVADAAGLLAAIDAGAPSIHLQPGVYALHQPLNFNRPVRITAAAGAVLEFVLSDAAGSPWASATGAIQIRASHVALDGFAIRFLGSTALWKSSARNVIQAGMGTVDVDLAFTRLNITAPAAAVAGVYEQAVALMNFEDGDTGLIAENVLQGGWIQLGAAPWRVVDNDYRGALADTISPTFLNAHRSFDLVIRGNHAHVMAPRGITQRFLVLGNADSGQGIGNLIERNTIDGGIGTPASGAPDGYTNNPEIILTETYQPRFEGVPSAVSPDGFIVQIPHLRGPVPRTGDVVSILTGPFAGQWRMIAQTLGPTRYLLDEPLPQGDFVIAVGRGFVDQTYRDNTIDLRGMSANNVAVVISGNHWNQRIEGNTFLGGSSLRIEAGSSEGAFEGPHPAPWGWSRLPVLGLKIKGNTFVDSAATIRVSHDRWASKASAGRTYLAGDFSDNVILWSNPSRPAVTIGAMGDPGRGELPYTLSNNPWMTPVEIVLTTRGNWGRAPATGAPATMRVLAAILDGATADDRLLSLPTASIVSAASHGQDGRDFIGSGPNSTGPDGFQDVHIVLAGLPAGKTIARVVVTGSGGGEWRYQGAPGTDRAVLVRNGVKADLYIQPYQDESGRSLVVDIYYTDGTSSRAMMNSLYASAKLPMPVNVSNKAATAAITARGDNATAGESRMHAFDGDPRTKWLDFSRTSWIQYEFAGGVTQVVTQYTITSANDTATFPGRAPKSWVLKGSNDGVTWTTLDVRNDEAIITNLTSRTYTIANSTAFHFYRLDAIVSNGDPIIQIGEITLQTHRVVAVASGGSTSSSPPPSTAPFGSDAYFTGGMTSSTTHAIDVSGVASPASQSVYQAERYGNFTYTIPGLTPGGIYTVRLHFAEIYWSEIGRRTFDVFLNGTKVLERFDILAAAGAGNRAIVREFTATADAAGSIVVAFNGDGQPDYAKVSGIEIVAPAFDLARGKTATSSSDESPGHAAAAALDGSAASRWSSGQWMRPSSVAWFVIDLGAIRDFDRVRLTWEAAFAVDYEIQTSDDGDSWTTVRSVVGATSGGVVEQTNLKARGRYVRIYMTRYNATKNYSLYGVNVFGS
ncbi:discoidin domain-containing protein [Planctomyces sp. SH-PL62]|uniref:discoidin domain-containing protein n=1 Tax=Planctomyces sp. SH-PL62 TaxID=1636152 RepID=UPI00078CD01D|nr:discoidin domain-containing protein [Planctomyces sp. SH-PL62]AMV37333.1 F5/8 type C domain protein [Planctomyces sp. SH-PL62]